MISYVSYALSEAWKWLYPTSLPPIDLQEIDLYTRETFQVLQQERFEKGNDYYICLVREGGKLYLFDAELFILDCIKAGNEVVAHPLTRSPIEHFEVYISSPDAPEFKFYMGSEALQPENRIPIFLTDSGFSEIDRRFLIESRADRLASKDKAAAKRLYEIAAARGSLSASLSLASLYAKEGDKESAIQTFSECLKKKGLTGHNALLSANILWGLGAYDLAIKFYEFAAERGNQYGLVILINLLEGEQANCIPKNTAEAEVWRQKLPEEWRKKPIGDYFEALKASGYSTKTAGRV